MREGGNIDVRSFSSGFYSQAVMHLNNPPLLPTSLDVLMTHTVPLTLTLRCRATHLAKS